MTEEEFAIARAVDTRFRELLAGPIAKPVWQMVLDENRFGPFERVKMLCLIFYEGVAAIQRSPFVVGDCRMCGAGTVHLDEGLPPICEPCAKKLADEN